MSRMYKDYQECYEEIKRDLAEMGILVKPRSMQDKNIEDDPDFFTKELQHYSYTLLNANSADIINVTQPWADAEFLERIKSRTNDNCYDELVDCRDCDFYHKQECTIRSESQSAINPGNAWKLRKEIWTEYLHEGKFAYTYNERINYMNQLDKIINRIKVDPHSRQLWLSTWDPTKDIDNLGGIKRVPCSLGYNFQIREGKISIHYIMRSCDFITHYCNDVYLAIKLLEYVADATGYKVGSFNHTVFSLHAYHKDLEGVF